METNKDQKFFETCDQMFANTLKLNKIRVFDIKNNTVLHDMNYSKVLFDNELNIYKKLDDGNIVKVDNPNFKGVVI